MTTHTAWTLKKDDRTLRCELTRDPVGGLELKLWNGDELLRSQVYRDQDDMLAAQQAWRAEAEVNPPCPREP
ncbi:MAG: hypothetical protein KJZ87_09160 [Thermoguttaceae bacterium]|nr:hypothetical protein [Thermoguttaceae bacterium]